MSHILKQESSHCYTKTATLITSSGLIKCKALFQVKRYTEATEA